MADTATDVQTAPPATVPHIAAQAAPLDEMPPEELDDLSMPGIRQISAAMAWLEALVTSLSGYALTGALAIGVIDILTDGLLTNAGDWVIYVYGISMAAGIGGQLVGLAYRSSRAFGRKSAGGFINGAGYLAIIAVLAYLEYISANAFGYHRAFGVPTIQTLHDLGWDQRSFIEFRNGVAVGLIILSGFLRYQPKVRKSIAQIQREAAYNAQVAEIQAQTRAQGIRNVAGLFGNVGQAARAAVAQVAQGTITEAPDAGAAAAQPPSQEDAPTPKI